MGAVWFCERMPRRLTLTHLALVTVASALWANLHGSFFLGTAIALVYGCGVWLGARIAVRLTGGDPEGRLVPTGAGGTIGLVLGLGLLILAVRVDVIIVAGLGLIAPGIGAAFGDRIALARRMRAQPKGT